MLSSEERKLRRQAIARHRNEAIRRRQPATIGDLEDAIILLKAELALKKDR